MGWMRGGILNLHCPSHSLAALGIGTALPDEIESQVVLCWNREMGTTDKDPKPSTSKAILF